MIGGVSAIMVATITSKTTRQTSSAQRSVLVINRGMSRDATPGQAVGAAITGASRSIAKERMVIVQVSTAASISTIFNRASNAAGRMATTAASDTAGTKTEP